MPFSKIRSVLICDGVDPVCGDILKKNGFNVICQAKLSLEKLLSEIVKYDALVVRSATKVTKEVMEAGTNLKLIARAGTGVDNIDCEAASRRGLIVMNAPGGNTLSAAEHTCALICSIARKIPQACASMKKGQWERKEFMGSELNGKTLAILGLGRIGREASEEFGVENMSLEDIWPQVDYITVHTPLIPQTKDLLNDEVFSNCKKGVFVVNCARGGIINEAALLRALESGQCGGAALDVFIQEPPTNIELLNHPNTICTPHLGASTREAQKRVALEIATQLLDLVKNKGINGLVNAPTLNQVMNEENKPWFELCHCLGVLGSSFMGQNNKNTLRNIRIDTCGEELFKKNKDFFSTSVLHGFLTKLKSQNVINVINTPVIAKETDLKVNVIQNDSPYPSHSRNDNSDEVLVTFDYGNYFMTVGGVVVGQSPVLCSIDGNEFRHPGVVMRGNVVIFKSDCCLDKIPMICGKLVPLKVQIFKL
ncbi:D-3-phosphoglycerate dehydrogenase [Nymphon striatum]|nr:D-3-phosphoglycerate dehydrogenase [Nymphon striatum]